MTKCPCGWRMDRQQPMARLQPHAGPHRLPLRGRAMAGRPRAWRRGIRESGSLGKKGYNCAKGKPSCDPTFRTMRRCPGNRHRPLHLMTGVLHSQGKPSHHQRTILRTEATLRDHNIDHNRDQSKEERVIMLGNPSKAALSQTKSTDSDKGPPETGSSWQQRTTWPIRARKDVGEHKKTRLVPTPKELKS